VKIQLLHVPGCHNLENARELLQSTLSELGLDGEIEVEEGAYASPTILVDGSDVMGSPDADGPSCRLDVPTHERLLAALQAPSDRGLRIQTEPHELGEIYRD
jgi:hypothetical protein